jgi:tRNA threonylcarbamoyladenosine biosynthesis protein TsaB
MITLAIDTSETRGSVALRIDGGSVSERVHHETDYSSWLLPAVENALEESGKTFEGLDLFAVSVGPGSFTGVRVGLCTVKALAEVYGKKVIGVSRLEALAWGASNDGLVAVSYDAHRGQAFGGLYRKEGKELSLVGEEMVIAPEEFLAIVRERCEGTAVQWISLDPGLFLGLAAWSAYEREGATLKHASAELANRIGEIAEERAARGEFTDILQLDANYVRRSDAEILWKGPAKRVG